MILDFGGQKKKTNKHIFSAYTDNFQSSPACRQEQRVPSECASSAAVFTLLLGGKRRTNRPTRSFSSFFSFIPPPNKTSHVSVFGEDMYLNMSENNYSLEDRDRDRLPPIINPVSPFLVFSLEAHSSHLEFCFLSPLISSPWTVQLRETQG